MSGRRTIYLSAEQAKALDDFAREMLRRLPSEPILPLCLCGRWRRRTRPCVPPMPWPERDER